MEEVVSVHALSAEVDFSLFGDVLAEEAGDAEGWHFLLFLKCESKSVVF